MQVERIGTLIPSASFMVKVEDVFNMKDFYKMVKEWLDEEDYFDEFGTENYREKLYLHRTLQGATEILVWQRTMKYPEGVNPKTGYLRYLLNVDYHVLYMKDVEVMHKGRKLKMQKGEVEALIKADVELDYRGEWKKHGFLGRFVDIFQKRIYRQEIEYHRINLYREAYRLQALIKRYLEAKGLFSPEEIKTYIKRSLG